MILITSVCVCRDTLMIRVPVENRTFIKSLGTCYIITTRTNSILLRFNSTKIILSVCLITRDDHDEHERRDVRIFAQIRDVYWKIFRHERPLRVSEQ